MLEVTLIEEGDKGYPNYLKGSGEKVYRLDIDVKVKHLLLGRTFHATVPAGFVTDGLSIPKILRVWFSPTEDGMRAAILHDYLLHVWRKGNPPPYISCRADCDRSFYRAMRCYCGRFKSLFFYAGVRLYTFIKGEG